jgi:hypothetical protein
MRAATTGDYEVGYGKPPRGAGFKKGQSGNPRGRPPGSKNLTTLLNDTLNEPVTITENGRRRKISKREAVIKQLVNKSASADPRSLKILLDLMLNLGAGAFFCRPDPGRWLGRRTGIGAAQGKTRRRHPRRNRGRNMTAVYQDSRFVALAKAGAQSKRLKSLDSRLRGNDRFSSAKLRCR